MCTAFRRVVVDTWDDCCAAELTIRELPKGAEEFEYIDIRLLLSMVDGEVRDLVSAPGFRASVDFDLSPTTSLEHRTVQYL